MGPELSGLLSDVNVEGHFVHLVRRLGVKGFREVFDEIGIRFVRFADLQIPPSLPDRDLWALCQAEGWVLFTANRNNVGPDPIQATLVDSWRPDDLPVITLSNKLTFESDPDYVERVAAEVADLLFGIREGEFATGPGSTSRVDARARSAQISISFAVYASAMMNLNRASGSLPMRSETVLSV